jgi:hypothetical protein
MINLLGSKRWRYRIKIETSAKELRPTGGNDAVALNSVSKWAAEAAARSPSMRWSGFLI